MKFDVFILLSIVIALACSTLSGVDAGGYEIPSIPTGTRTPAPSHSSTRTPAPSHSSTRTPSRTPTKSFSSTPSGSPSLTDTPSATISDSPSSSNSGSRTPTSSQTATMSRSLSSSTTPSITPFPSLVNAPIFLNPSDKSARAVLSTDLLQTMSPAKARVRVNIGKFAGKWYWEQRVDTAVPNDIFGMGSLSMPLDDYYESGQIAGVYNTGSLWKVGAGGIASIGGSIGGGDMLSYQLDMDAGTLTMYKNNALMTTITNIRASFTTAYPFSTGYSTMNFGSKTFAYAVPSGYLPYDFYPYPTPSNSVTMSISASPSTSHIVSVLITFSSTDKSAAAVLSTNKLQSLSAAKTRARATVGRSSGKWYWEQTINTYLGNDIFGVGSSSMPLDGYYESTQMAGVYSTGGLWKIGTGGIASLGAAFTTGQVLSFALDMDAGTLAIYKNNVLQTNIGSIRTYFSVAYPFSTGQTTTNFGRSAFVYSPPSGFAAYDS